jgi:hypothetical protein
LLPTTLSSSSSSMICRMDGSLLVNSVQDPYDFYTDPDPRICVLTFRIWILLILMRLLKEQKNIFF